MRADKPTIASILRGAAELLDKYGEEPLEGVIIGELTRKATAEIQAEEDGKYYDHVWGATMKALKNLTKAQLITMVKELNEKVQKLSSTREAAVSAVVFNQVCQRRAELEEEVNKLRAENERLGNDVDELSRSYEREGRIVNKLVGFNRGEQE